MISRLLRWTVAGSFLCVVAAQEAHAQPPSVGMPGDFVARPVTLPGGLVNLEFTDYTVFIDALESLGWMPSIAVGITSDLEVGFQVPVRYDQGLAAWTTLDPILHLACAWLRAGELQAAVRVQALIPATSDAGAALGVGAPFIWNAASVLRLTAFPQLELGLHATPTQARMPIGIVVQTTPWLYTGVEAGPDLGLSHGGKTAVDGHFLLGLTLQTRGTAHLDLTVRFFVENAGAGSEDRFSDGAGTIISFALFPKL